MNRRELLGACVGAVGLGVGGLQQQQAKVVIPVKIRALDPEGFARFALRDRVRLSLGVSGLPNTGEVSALEERFSRNPELAEVRYRVELDGPGYRRLWVGEKSVELE